MILRLPYFQGLSEEKVFSHAVAASVALHLGFVFIMTRAKAPQAVMRPPIEIDLTQPAGTGPRKLAAPKRKVPGAVPAPPHIPIPVEPEPVEETPPLEPAPAEVQKPEDWVLPGETTEKVEKLVTPRPVATPGGTEDGIGTASKLGGSGAGYNDGVPGGTGTGAGGTVLAYPVLLNLEELLDNIQRFYPENERRAGSEGAVKVTLHISAAGVVTRVSVVGTGGRAFDKAAKRISRLMRFKAAATEAGPVAVKINQTIVFQLED